MGFGEEDVVEGAGDEGRDGRVDGQSGKDIVHDRVVDEVVCSDKDRQK